MKFTIMITGFLLFAVPTAASAHPGRLDSSGGHKDNVSGGYHTHPERSNNSSDNTSTPSNPKSRYKTGKSGKTVKAIAKGVLLEGRPIILDGDTIKMGGAAIRIHGIDAPELDQICSVGKKSYKCGVKALRALESRINGGYVQCLGRERDKYGRTIATCSTKSGDIGRWMVGEGYALAYRKYSMDYIDAEDGARKYQRGMWAGTFTPPWDWRKGIRGN